MPGSPQGIDKVTANKGPDWSAPNAIHPEAWPAAETVPAGEAGHASPNLLEMFSPPSALSTGKGWGEAKHGGMATIFERYGGFAAIRKIVSDFYDRVLDSPELEAYFLDIEMPRLIDHQTKFIATITGGPASISNEEIRRAHHRLNIPTQHFREVALLLEETLEDHGFTPEDVAQVMSEVGAREAYVVKGS